MKILSKILIGLFIIITFIDLYFSWKGLFSGYHETHIFSGLQFGIIPSVVLKCFEIAIIYFIVKQSEMHIDDHTGIPASPFFGGIACLSGFIGASGTWRAIPELI